VIFIEPLREASEMKAPAALRKSGGSDIIARRSLVEPGTRRKIEIVFHAPRPMLSGKREEWACLLEIRRGRQPPQQLYGRGEDSLQSLVAALGTAFHTLRLEPSAHRNDRDKPRAKKKAAPRSA
jgi:hypothetical protein